MTEAEILKLETAAKKASGGEWTASRDLSVFWVDNDLTRGTEDSHIAKLISDNDEEFSQKFNDASYIAAANPQAILFLIAELRRAQASEEEM